MQNHFLCCSIIIMFITCSTCETVDVVSGDVALPPGHRYSTTLGKPSKRNEVEHVNMDLETQSKFGHDISFEVRENISVPMEIEEINKTWTNSPHTKKITRKTYSKGQTSRSSNTKGSIEKTLHGHPQNTISSHPLGCNCSSSCIFNFKSRKKEESSECAFSEVSSSQTIVCNVSPMNYINSSSILKNSSQHFTQTEQYNKRDTSTPRQISKRTRKRKSTPSNNFISSVSDANRNPQEESLIKSSRKRRRPRTKNDSEIHKSLPKLSSDQVSVEGLRKDHKKKLLRQELMEILKNKTLPSLKSLKLKTTYPGSVQLETTTDTELSPVCVEVPVQNIGVVSFNEFSTKAKVRRNKTKKKAKLSMPLVANFLLSEESHLSESGNESLLNDFDEICLNSANPEAEKAGLLCSNQMFLYVPKNGSIKSFSNVSGKGTTKRLKSESRLKYETSNPSSLNIIKGATRNSRRKSHVDVVKNETWALTPKRTTSFDLFKLLIHRASSESSPIKKVISTFTQKLKTDNIHGQIKKRININKFLMSAEDIDLNEVGPTVNVFSESKQDCSAGNHSESHIVSDEVTMLDTEKLPDISQCETFWNRTFRPPKNSFEITWRQSFEFSTLSSVEAMNVIRQNFSGFLTRKSILSGLSTVHPLLDPLASKFDDSILPNDEEAKRIFAKYLNQSVKEVEEKWFTTRITENVQSETFLSLSQLEKLDLDYMSMSQGWKELIQENLAKTKPHFTDVREFTFPLPDTAEAEEIFRENDMSLVIKDMKLRKNKQTSLTRPFAPSTLSMKDALQIFRHMGIELLGATSKS
ncbi:hypothetical protein WDU94_011041 [Cyamophila willieti]